MPTTAMAAMADMEAMADTDTARGPLMPMPTTAMADMAVMEAMADTDMARGPLMPRPTMVPDTDMAVMEVMAVVCTDTERGLLMPMPTTAMAATEVMEAMADTDTARGPLMPMPTTAMAAMAVMEAMADTERGPLTLTTDMVVMAVVTDTAMASNSFKSVTIRELSVLLMILTQ